MLGQVRRRVATAAVLAFSLVACAGERRPATEATTAILRGDAGVAQDAGIQVAASVGAWEAQPPHLETELTPVLVQILNQGQRPLRVTYDVFQFSDPSGVSFVALPPYEIQAEGVRPVHGGRPHYRYAGFAVAPYLRGYYPQLAVYGGPFAFSDRYYIGYAPAWSGHSGLPTQDMLERALPEGVVEPGGRVGGFLYFQRLKGGRPYTFGADLVDALTGERFGVIAIPFVAE